MGVVFWEVGYLTLGLVFGFRASVLGPKACSWTRKLFLYCLKNQNPTPILGIHPYSCFLETLTDPTHYRGVMKVFSVLEKVPDR